VAGTGGGGGDEGSSPGSDEVITATSVAGGEMGPKEADTYECVEGHNDKVGGNHQLKSPLTESVLTVSRSQPLTLIAGLWLG